MGIERAGAMMRVCSRTAIAGSVVALLCASERGLAQAPQPDAAALRPPASSAQTGIASWYGPRFHGRRTASGEIYDMHDHTAAHRTLPLGSVVEITNLENGRSAVARINDRGPYIRNRIVDCSHAVANTLGFVGDGLAKVSVRVLDSMRPRRDATPEPVEVAVVEDAAPAPPADPKFCVQLGAFRDDANAQVLVRRASILPLPVFVQAVRAVQQVLVGPFTDVDTAAAARRDLRLAGLAGFVRTYEAPVAPAASGALAASTALP
jgi:rare lipoprotein A